MLNTLVCHNLLCFLMYAFSAVKQERGENLPRLSAIETTKLQRLSLVSVASEHHSLEYKHLMGILRVESVRALEDLVLDSVAAGLIEGQLDQKRGVFEVQYAMGRDIGANDVDKMLNKLNDWLSHSAIVRQELKNRHAHANSAIEKTTAAEKKITDERAKLIEDILKEREEKKRKDASAGRMGAGPGQARGRGPFL
jgi:COP9 signalosome complex subunit 7